METMKTKTKAKLSQYESPVDNVPVVHVDTEGMPEDSNGPIIRIYLNDEYVYANPPHPNSKTSDDIVLPVSKHTPGPWHYGEPVKAHARPMVWDKDGWQIAECSGSFRRSHDEATANAVLMAAAPSLLTEIKNLRECAAQLAERLELDASESIWAFIADATDAISKAEGRADK